MRLTIFDIDNWKEIGATLSRNKTRTFLTGFGIFWGVAMLALLMGGARGGEDMLRRNFAGFATNSGGIVPEQTTIPYKGISRDRSWQMDMTDVELLRTAVPQLDVVVPTFSSWGRSFRAGNNTYSGQVIGAPAEYTRMLEPKIWCGRFINEADVANGRRVAVIGKRAAESLFPDNETPLGETVMVNDVAYSVVGVVGKLGEINLNGDIEESIILPMSTFARSFGRNDKIDFMMLVVKPGYKLADLMTKIRSLIYRRHNIHPDDESAMWVIDVSEKFEMVDNLFKGVNLLALFIGFSTLMAGIIGIGNIMWVIVKERTQEIGIRRAIGAKPSDIIVQILSEGTALTIIAGLAGICFAALILGVMHHLQNGPDAVSEAHFQMSFAHAGGILALFVVLGTLAGLIPSIKAMKIKPVEAINDK